jgi:hypothetical protein
VVKIGSIVCKCVRYVVKRFLVYSLSIISGSGRLRKLQS